MARKGYILNKKSPTIYIDLTTEGVRINKTNAKSQELFKFPYVKVKSKMFAVQRGDHKRIKWIKRINPSTWPPNGTGNLGNTRRTWDTNLQICASLAQTAICYFWPDICVKLLALKIKQNKVTRLPSGGKLSGKRGLNAGNMWKQFASKALCFSRKKTATGVKTINIARYKISSYWLDKYM